jgi:hypothetical protein
MSPAQIESAGDFFLQNRQNVCIIIPDMSRELG